MATNDDALGSRALLSLVFLLGTSLGVAAAAPGNDTSASAERGSTSSDAKTKVAESRRLQSNRRLAPGTAVGLNPQPLPPKARIIGTKTNPGTAQGLNPQPLPPGGRGGGGLR
jgi:hypothetical protein